MCTTIYNFNGKIMPDPAPTSDVPAPQKTYVPCEDVLIFKQGCDLRLAQFQQVKRRIDETQDHLTRKWNEIQTEKILSFRHEHSQAHERLRATLKNSAKEYNRGCEQLYYDRQERDILKDEMERLRKVLMQRPLRDGLDPSGFHPPNWKENKSDRPLMRELEADYRQTEDTDSDASEENSDELDKSITRPENKQATEFREEKRRIEQEKAENKERRRKLKEEKKSEKGNNLEAGEENVDDADDDKNPDATENVADIDEENNNNAARNSTKARNSTNLKDNAGSQRLSTNKENAGDGTKKPDANDLDAALATLDML